MGGDNTSRTSNFVCVLPFIRIYNNVSTTPYRFGQLTSPYLLDSLQAKTNPELEPIALGQNGYGELLLYSAK